LKYAHQGNRHRSGQQCRFLALVCLKQDKKKIGEENLAEFEQGNGDVPAMKNALQRKTDIDYPQNVDNL
jgi:hypothetical protein